MVYYGRVTRPYTHPPGTRPAVLIVDDDPSVAQVFSTMLSLEGYEVITATSAETGLHQATDRHMDAILLDLRMPVLDGIEFLRRLRAVDDGHHTPVAIVTGDYFVDETVLSVLREFGVKLYFKPLWFEDVVRITNDLVQAA
jgi:two-component system OmpR family response regulator